MRMDLNGLPTRRHRGGCAELNDLRDELQLPGKIQYAKRIVQTQAVDNFTRQSITHAEPRLMPAFKTVSFDDAHCRLRDGSMANGGDRITVQYERAKPIDVDTSSIMIGASTSLKRLEVAIPQMARWLANTKASLVVNVHDSDNRTGMTKVQKMADAAGIDATLLPNDDYVHGPDQGHAQKHFSIIKRLHRRKESHHKWFAIIDDDTFFVSLRTLIKALEPYDSAKSWYIGALSEDWTAIKKYGLMAYGGAGILLSAPLLDVLHDNFDLCMRSGTEGDKLYSDCIYGHTLPPVQMTQLDGLHQLDVRGDASGWYESGIEPVLSLHHYNSWHRYPVEYGHLISDLCGSCFLRRYRFGENVVMTNGYSVVQYPDGIDDNDLDRVEGTFSNHNDQFSFSLGHLRPKLSAREKISWRLEYAMKAKDGAVRQFYVKRSKQGLSDAERLRSDVESVFEVEWKP